MDIRYFLFFGFVFTQVGLNICSGSQECPNAPVTPYPIPLPVTPYPVGVPNPTTCCSNQQTNSCQTSCSQTCCNTCNSTTSCCGSTNKCCNQQQTNPTQMCSGSTTSCCGSTNNCCNQQQTNLIQPCGSTNSCCGSTNNCCNQQQTNPTQPCQPCQNCGTPSPTCTETTTTTTTTQSPQIPETTTERSPDPIIKCPPGTKLIGTICHLIYCPRGYEMVNDRCIVIECPQGTIWMGHRCSVPEPIIHNVTYYNTIITKFNETKPDIIINNTNNIVVNASVSLSDNDKPNNGCNNNNNDYEDCDDSTLIKTTTVPTSLPTTQPTKLECCDVMTPRICENHNNRWRCYSRRSHRCGDFCVAPIIYLKPQRVHVRPHYVVMPPIQHDCQLEENCNSIGGGHDCSGCAINDMERCSYYCYRYLCPSRRCDFYDQERYCTHNSGLYGCKQEDGCLDNWCL